MSTKNVKYIMTLKGDFNKKLKGANVSVNKFNKTTNVLKTTMKSLVPVMGAIGGVAVFSKIINTAMAFEKEMSGVKAISGATETQFKSLEKQAEELGRSTVFSAKEAAEGMRFLSMAGFSVKKTMEALPGTLDLAAAGTISLGQAADIASNVLTQFGLNANEMNRVNDVIVATTTKTNTSVEQLAEGLKYVGTTAKILKVPLEETNAALGVMANAGLQGSMGGTSLNFALLEMARISSPTAKKLKALGVNTHDAAGKFIGLTNILEQFEAKGVTSSKILDTFGARGGRAMGTLVEAGSDVIKSFTQINKSSQGIAKRIAKMKLDNLAGDMTLLKSASQGAAISLGKRMNPAMRKTVKIATKTVGIFEKMVRIPVEEEIRKETLAATALIGKLRNANIKEGDRLEIIKKLNEISPSLTKGLDSENISMSRLTTNLRSYNKEQAKRVVLASLEEKEQKLINKEAKRRADIERVLSGGAKGGMKGGLLATRERLIEAGLKEDAKNLGKFIDAINEENIKKARLIFKESGFVGFTKDEARRAIKDIEKINEKTSETIDIRKRIEAFQKQLDVGEETKKAVDPVTGVITTDKKADKLATQITSRSPKIINININKLIETQEINTQTLTEGAPKIKEMITKILLEGINDTQISYKAS